MNMTSNSKLMTDRKHKTKNDEKLVSQKNK